MEKETFILTSNKDGEIDLGNLEGVNRVNIQIENFSEMTYIIDNIPEIYSYPKVISAMEGENIEIPFMGKETDFKQSRINIVRFLDEADQALEVCFKNLEYVK